jgi:hypothetical protein
MADTFEKIASVTIGAGGGGIAFSSIPNTYTSLRLLLSTRGTESSYYTNLIMNFNGSSASNYSFVRAIGVGGGTSTDGFSGQTTIYIGESNGATSTSGIFSNFDVLIGEYNTTKSKTVTVTKTMENNTGTSSYILGYVAAMWADTSTINSISIAPTTGTFVQYSTATLYGIKAA